MIAGLLSALALSTPANACVDVAWPNAWPQAETAVPADATLWIDLHEGTRSDDSGDDVALLRDSDGAEVPLSVIEHLQGEQLFLELLPDAPLDPAETYTLDLRGEHQWPVLVDAAAAEPPGPAEITGAYAHHTKAPDGQYALNGSCNADSNYIQVRAEAEGAALYEVEIAESDDFSDAAALYALSGFFRLGWGTGADNFPEIAPRTTYHLRVRAIGADGSVGDWSDRVAVENPRAPLGCSAVPAAPGAGWLGLALAALAIRRRSALS